jgi:hypothetical protein
MVYLEMDEEKIFNKRSRSEETQQAENQSDKG